MISHLQVTPLPTLHPMISHFPVIPPPAPIPHLPFPPPLCLYESVPLKYKQIWFSILIPPILVVDEFSPFLYFITVCLYKTGILILFPLHFYLEDKEMEDVDGGEEEDLAS